MVGGSNCPFTIDAMMDRTLYGCLCCGSRRLEQTPTAISPFLASQAWGGHTEPTTLAACADCGFRFFRRGLSAAETKSYYGQYRSETYYRERHRFEPFYTRAVHDAGGRWLRSSARRLALARSLANANAPARFDAALDYGGGSGALLRDIAAARKAVFDLSPETPEAGVEEIRDIADIGVDWDLVLNAQVLEHLSDPRAAVHEMLAALRPGGHLYLEVPEQSWREPLRLSAGRARLVEFLCRHPRLYLAADVYSTAFRVKAGVLPPLGFVPMREHVNFFTLSSLAALASTSGADVVTRETNVLGALVVVARKGRQ
jgi:SAM-dependent methyltransferase